MFPCEDQVMGNGELTRLWLGSNVVRVATLEWCFSRLCRLCRSTGQRQGSDFVLCTTPAREFRCLRLVPLLKLHQYETRLDQGPSWGVSGVAEVNLTVRELRRLWKPQKERLNQEHHQHPTNIRFHRACSWLQRVEEIQDDAVLDHVLLSLWTAFNALYGQWDGERQEPVSQCSSAESHAFMFFPTILLRGGYSGLFVNTVYRNIYSRP